jgi:hypothetical protein
VRPWFQTLVLPQKKKKKKKENLFLFFFFLRILKHNNLPVGEVLPN